MCQCATNRVARVARLLDVSRALALHLQAKMKICPGSAVLRALFSAHLAKNGKFKEKYEKLKM